MPLILIDDQVHAAVAAAAAAYDLAHDFSSPARARVHVSDLAKAIRALQASFDKVKPLAGLDPTRVAAVLGDDYGVADPGAVLALIPAAQVAGDAVIVAIEASDHGPTKRAAYAYDAETGQLYDVLLTEAETAGMGVPWAALVSALAPIAAG